MEFNWIQMWSSMSPLAKGVAVVLIIMGLMSLSVFIERSIVIYRHRKSSKVFLNEVAPLLANPHFSDALAITDKYSTSYAAKVMIKGIKDYQVDKDPKKVSNKLERYYESLSHEMRRGLTVLSTVASTAPFVGLLGTVIGIVSAFRGIAQAGSGGLAAVSAGIAEALVETALGLFVAIPAVIMFYYLSVKIDKEEITVRSIGGELVEKMEEDIEIRKPAH
ncbi:MAG: MotA/TolQ/ExbB proton channel family protein [Nitrospirae bacterium]|nr:MotA/TolQ/ExbB proton channel family protein [Nitrospirota bacterium]